MVDSNEYNISVVMAVYNTEDFLGEAIDSLINQTIGFENVELILVDDGSTDKSKDICLKYQNQFPENIVYIHQENQGQATARNNGMKAARGKYINFLDSDDKLEANALEEVYNFFEAHYNDIDIVSIPIRFFDRQRGGHMLNYKYNSTRVVDLEKHYDYIQLSASASFVKRDAIKDHLFDTHLIVSEDAIFINKILLEKRKMGVISNTAYYYRKRHLNDSTVDLSVQNRNYYIQRSQIFFKKLMDYSMEKYGEIYDFIKYTVAYDIQWIFNMRNIKKILDDADLKTLKSILYDILQEIDDEIIMKQKYHDKNLKYNMLIFKHGGLETEVLHDNVKKVVNCSVLDELYYHVFYLDAFEINKNRLNILGYLKSYFKYPEIKIEAVEYSEDDFEKYWLDYLNRKKVGFLEWEYLTDEGFKFKNDLINNPDANFKDDDLSTYIKNPKIDLNFTDEEEFQKRDYIDEVTFKNVKKDALKKYLDKHCKVHASQKVEYPLREEKYLDQNYISYYNFEFDIPLTGEANFRLRAVYDNINFYLTVKMENYCKITEQSFYSHKENYLIQFRDNAFKLMKYTIPKLLELEKSNIEYFEAQNNKNLAEIIQFRKRYYYSYLKYAGRRIWLFMDRLDVADDSGEYLFQYALKQDDGIEKYFIINEDSRDFNRLIKLGNVIPAGSHKHKMLACHAEKIISSQADAVVINPFYKNEKFLNGLFKAKVYFLQHGVIKEDISSWLHRYDKYLYLILTSTKDEYESFFAPTAQYNHPKSVVQLLGLPRHDTRKRLEDKKEIVVMPSWRRSLEHLTEDQFRDSKFYKTYNSLLNNTKMLEFLESEGYKLIFKPHHNLKRHMHLFERHPSVEFDYGDKKSTHTYKDIFNHSSLIITDYSSAVFDFAYIKKPIIYYHSTDDYHFDVENSFFNYETMGFGEIAKSEEGLVNLVMNYVNINCEMKEEYKKRVDNFFEYHDENNCKRAYEFILNDAIDLNEEKLDNEELRKLIIKFDEEFCQNADVESRIKRTELINNKLTEELEERQAKIKALNEELDKKQAEIDTFLNSNSWKITKPLRKVIGIMKKGD